MRFALSQMWTMIAQAIGVISKGLDAVDAVADVAKETAEDYRDEIRTERATKAAALLEAPKQETQA